MSKIFNVKLCTTALLLCFAFITICAAQANAAGFALYEWSARGNALGGALTAIADDPSAVAYNPAGITQLEGTHTLAGVSAIAPQNDVKTTYGGAEKTESIKEKYFFPPHAYITHQMSDNVWFGFGAFTRYGLGTTFSESWRGRYSSYDTSIESYSFNPNFAFKINEYISVALGMELMYVKADLRSKKDPTGALNPDSSGATDVDQRIRVDGITPGFNAAVRVTPNDQWALGFSYRSQMNHRADGNVRYDVPVGVDTTNLYNETDIVMSMSTPNTFAFGVAYKPLENLSFEADAILSQWSCYSELQYNFSSAKAIGVKKAVVAKKWRDAWRFQFGVEYSPIETIDLRAGYVFDQSPIREGYEDYMLPTNDRQIVSGGIGFNYDDFVLDFSYSYLWMKKREIDARPGTGVLDSETENSITHIMGVSLGYTF